MGHWQDVSSEHSNSTCNPTVKTLTLTLLCHLRLHLHDRCMHSNVQVALILVPGCIGHDVWLNVCSLSYFIDAVSRLVSLLLYGSVHMDFAYDELCQDFLLVSWDLSILISSPDVLHWVLVKFFKVSEHSKSTCRPTVKTLTLLCQIVVFISMMHAF